LSSIEQLIPLTSNSDKWVSGAAHYALWSISPKTGQATGWEQIRSTEWELSAVLPTPIERKELNVPTPYGEAILATFASSLGPIRFTVAVAQYDPQIAINFSEEDRYNSSAEETPKHLGGKLVEFAEIEQNGIEGRKQVIDIPNEATLVTHAFIVGDRSYQIQIAYPQNCKPHPEMERYFLDSLVIARQKK
jgi:hypothetical protein